MLHPSGQRDPIPTFIPVGFANRRCGSTILDVLDGSSTKKPSSDAVIIFFLVVVDRASSKVKVTSLRSSWAVKEKRRAELNAIKERNRAAAEEREKAWNEEAARIRASRERREANSLKNVKYQVVTDTSKLKKLSKAQWKNYRKLADINKW